MTRPPACVAHHEHGFVLPAAIMALVVISALVAGALVISSEELRAGRTDLAAQRAFAAAELALERTIATWDVQLNVSARVGETRTLAVVGDSRGDTTVVTAMRTHERTFWITSRGTSHADGRPIPARATIGASTRLIVPVVPVQAALTVSGAATIDGGTVDGRDATSGAGTGVCPWSAADIAGIIAPDSSRVCGADCATGAPPGVTGAPPVAVGGGLTSDSAAMSRAWASAAERATATLPGGDLDVRPVVAGGRCVRADPLNWGDPSGAGACVDHFPVIRITGNATLVAGSAGQGILLVDGSLRVASGARFDGIVLARNDVVVDGADAVITGLAIALDADGVDGSVVRSGGTIRFASCIARRALLGAARLTRTPERWWTELR